MKLTYSFFKNKKTLELAKELIGKVLVYKTPQGILKGIINETEAYTEQDESCHAFGGKKTPRNETMFKKAGHLYVYFTYGMYHCCNIVTGEKDKGEAVLIRSIIPIKGIDIMKKNRKLNTLKNLTNGPAKLCIAFGINKKHDKLNLLDKNSKIYLEEKNYKPKKIKQTKRIGISKSKDLEWRFICLEFGNYD